MRQALYGHVSEETAYVVKDYPYGFAIRCQIKYWLEMKPSQGYRFVTRTLNPKTGLWNAPKKSTYIDMSANMYLDSAGHVQWAGLSMNDSVEKVFEFIRDFPGNPSLRDLLLTCVAHIKYLDRRVEGKSSYTINGVTINVVPQKVSEYEIACAYWERDCWKYIMMATPLNEVVPR